MIRLFTYLGIFSPEMTYDNKIVEISHHGIDKSIDMHAFTQWCNEFGVSRLVSKTNEFTVTIGNHEKHVKLDRI